MIIIAVVEDELEMQQEIVKNINRGIGNDNIIEVDQYFTAEEFLKVKKDYNMVITDIELPGISGLELGRKIKKWNPEIYLIFLTSYSEFAFESYIIEAYQYILKSDMEERLPLLVDKVIHIIEKNEKEYIKVGTNQKWNKIYYKDIIYIEKMKGSKYANYVTSEGQYLERKSLNLILEELHNQEFIFIDRSHIININHINKLWNNIVYMDNGDEIFISRTQGMEIKEKITEFWRIRK